MTDTKCILSLRIARTLLNRGCQLIDVDTSSKRAGNIVFIFKRDGHFDLMLAELSSKGR